MKFIILFLLVLLVILIFLTALVSWFTFPFLFLPPLGRSKVKGGLPIPSFFELADHGDHVIQVKANPSLHILSNGQSLCLYTQFLGSHQTSILQHCAVNQSSEDEDIFLIDGVQGFLCIWAEIDQSFMKILAEDANILFMGSQGPMLIPHSLHLRPYSSLEPAKMDAWRIGCVFDSLHDQLHLIAQRFVLLFIHFPLIGQIHDHHLTCCHSFSYLFFLLFLLGLYAVEISPSLNLVHR